MADPVIAAFVPASVARLEVASVAWRDRWRNPAVWAAALGAGLSLDCNSSSPATLLRRVPRGLRCMRLDLGFVEDDDCESLVPYLTSLETLALTMKGLSLCGVRRVVD